MALGATRSSVLRLVMRQGLRAVLVGLAFGMIGAFLLSRGFRASLVGVNGNDPASYGAASLSLGVAAMMACWLPARRAIRVNPSEALRAE